MSNFILNYLILFNIKILNFKKILKSNKKYYKLYELNKNDDLAFLYISIFYLNIIAIILQYIYILSYKSIINAICFILFFYIYIK